MSGSKRLGVLLLGAVAVVLIFQLLTLNLVALNGDEALYVLILEEIQKLKAGTATLNPVTGYAGPLDFWTMGSVYAVLSQFLKPLPWMVRIVPLTVFWSSFACLWREIRKHSQELADWTAFSAAITPMVLVYSRTAWPHAFLLGLLSLLLAEALRAERTGEFRWFRVAVPAGLAVETHPTAFLGILIVLGPVFPVLFRRLRTEPGRALGALGVFAALAYPVVRNFPPPVSAEPSPSVFFEFRSFVNTITGAQPFSFLTKWDPAPYALIGIYLLFLIYLYLAQARLFLRSREALDRMLFKFWVVQLVGTGVLLFLTYRGRTISHIGAERYLMILVPGWVFLTAHAWMNLRKAPRLLASVLFAFLFLRFSIPVVAFSKQTDPVYLAMNWLQKECPEERCLPYAENFFHYWPMRYYSGDRMELDYFDYNWKTVSRPAPHGRELAGCWHYRTQDDLLHEPRMYRGPFKKVAYFEPQAGIDGMVCFLGLEKR